MGRVFGAALCGITGSSDGAHSQERWYISHLRKEVCVPIDDIGPDLERLYYGTGPVHTPADFARYMRLLGYRIKEIPSPKNVPEYARPHLKVYHAIGYGQTTNFVLFDDPNLCKAAMAGEEP